jgi:hypothetical protein
MAVPKARLVLPAIDVRFNLKANLFDTRAKTTVEQQNCLMLHRARHLFIRQQTAVMTSKRLDAIPGIGPALATALVASIADPSAGTYSAIDASGLCEALR